MRGEPAAAGFRRERHASLPSTNDLLRDYAAAGEPEGLIVTAERQTAGRGRQGRAWSSPPGNLYASLLLRPAGPLAAAATLSLVVPLSVVDALAGLLDSPTRLAVKWPNDVLLDGAKLAGILLEGADDGAGGCAWVIAGVGVNLAAVPDGLPYAATSLARATGRELTPDAFLDAWLPPPASPPRRLECWRLCRAPPGLACPRPPARVRGQPAARRRADQRPLRRPPRRRLDRPGAGTRPARALHRRRAVLPVSAALASGALGAHIPPPRATPVRMGPA